MGPGSEAGTMYRSTRFNSLTSTSSASASITPPHTVSRSGITMRFDGG
jgi:hypothetical protein